jgi:hypothetical protein
MFSIDVSESVMEELKRFEEVYEPDVRQRLYVIFDSNLKQFRPLTLKDIHNIANSIELHNGVPEEIRSHFEMARNLFIYSWFYYPFNVAAQLQAFTTAEYALRQRANISIASRNKPGFKGLLKMAVNQAWISDKGFSHAESARLKATSNILSASPEQRKVETYCKALMETLPRFRDELAHGSTMLHNQGAIYLLTCAELINQLFQVPKENI